MGAQGELPKLSFLRRYYGSNNIIDVQDGTRREKDYWF